MCFNCRIIGYSIAMFGIIALSTVTAAESPRPNFVFIMADDLGWADVGFHGGKTPTPNLDRLKGESFELTRHYAYPVCTPTRSALLSGRCASRFGITNPQNPRAYRWNTTTLPRALQSVGYKTALCGKWHLGSNPDWGPQKFGFDHSYGSLAGGVGPWDHRYKKGEFTETWHRNGALINETGHVTDLITQEAINWLGTMRDSPFFLYVPFTAVHIPIREPDSYLKRVPTSIQDPAEREYSACLLHLDDAVGRLLDALDHQSKRENTIVVFTSDNGGVVARNDDPSYPADNYAPGKSDGNNRPLRGQKATVYEGGTRTVMLVRWPAKLKPGSSDVPTHITDWMPTFCHLARFTSSAELKWDGSNIEPILKGQQSIENRSLYSVGPNWRSSAVWFGEWKLVIQEAQPQDDSKRVFELYNLKSDPNESTDLAMKLPDQVRQMINRWEQAKAADRDSVADDE